MIDKDNFHVFNYIKKEEYTASMSGMRYMLRKKETEDGTVLEVVIWPEPYSFEATEPDKKHGRDFAFSGDGLWEAVDWLNQEYEAGYNRQRAGGVRQ